MFIALLFLVVLCGESALGQDFNSEVYPTNFVNTQEVAQIPSSLDYKRSIAPFTYPQSSPVCQYWVVPPNDFGACSRTISSLANFCQVGRGKGERQEAESSLPHHRMTHNGGKRSNYYGHKTTYIDSPSSPMRDPIEEATEWFTVKCCKNRQLCKVDEVIGKMAKACQKAKAVPVKPTSDPSSTYYFVKAKA